MLQTFLIGLKHDILRIGAYWRVINADDGGGGGVGAGVHHPSNNVRY